MDAFSELESIRIKTREILPRHPLEASVTSRQEIVPGFVQAKLSNATILQIGAGGIGGRISQGLVRKGIGCLKIIDHDIVELSNLTRQPFFEEDLYHNKAVRLARNVAREATCQSTIIGHPFSFQECVERSIDLACDVVVCGVDNDRTRADVARFFLGINPVVFIGVSRDADYAYAFVQKPGEPCFGCLFPDAVDSEKVHRCAPAMLDILEVACGMGIFAVDSLIMGRRRNWNRIWISLSGQFPSGSAVLERRENCPICGKVQSPNGSLGPIGAKTDDTRRVS